MFRQLFIADTAASSKRLLPPNSSKRIHRQSWWSCGSPYRHNSFRPFHSTDLGIGLIYAEGGNQCCVCLKQKHFVATLSPDELKPQHIITVHVLAFDTMTSQGPHESGCGDPNCEVDNPGVVGGTEKMPLSHLNIPVVLAHPGLQAIAHSPS